MGCSILAKLAMGNSLNLRQSATVTLHLTPLTLLLDPQLNSNSRFCEEFRVPQVRIF